MYFRTVIFQSFRRVRNIPRLKRWTCNALIWKILWRWHSGAETCRRLIFVINSILLSAIVGWCIDYQNMHGMDNIKWDHNVYHSFKLFKIYKSCLPLQKAKLDNTVNKLRRNASLFETYVKRFYCAAAPVQEHVGNVEGVTSRFYPRHYMEGGCGFRVLIILTPGVRRRQTPAQICIWREEKVCWTC
jgi:hypothetical protein